MKHKQASRKIMYEKRIILILFTIYLALPKEHYCKNYPRVVFLTGASDVTFREPEPRLYSPLRPFILAVGRWLCLEKRDICIQRCTVDNNALNFLCPYIPMYTVNRKIHPTHVDNFAKY